MNKLLLAIPLIFCTSVFSANLLSCSFSDSKNNSRNFKLTRFENDNNKFKDLDGKKGPSWSVVSEDDKRLILFKELNTNLTSDSKFVNIIFFIDKVTGNFRFRNYLHLEYVNTVRGSCEFP